MKLMGDNNDGMACLTHVAQHCKQLVCLLGCEDGCGLVQNQDIHPAVQKLYDLHSLLLGYGHGVYLLVRIQLKPVFGCQLIDFGGHSLHVQHFPSGQSQDNVLSRCQNIHQLEMLVNHADTQSKGVLRRTNGNLLSVYEYLPFIRVVDTGNHVHKGGLSASVLTQDGQDFPPFHRQAYLVVGSYLAEPFCDIFQFNCVFFAHPANLRSLYLALLHCLVEKSGARYEWLRFYSL